MTKEEVLNKIETEEKWLSDAGYNTYNADVAFNSIKQAVKSMVLGQKSTENFESTKDHILKLAGDYKCWDNRLTHDEALELCHMLEQEPCADAVSKKAVLGLFNKSDMRSWAMSLLKREIEEIPPVKPVACIADIKFSKEDMQKLVNEKIKEITVEQRWIPVKERLPKESLNSVIGWDAYRERCVFVQYIDGCFQITGKNESFDIQAWMPLPKPYVPDTNVGDIAEMEGEDDSN